MEPETGKLRKLVGKETEPGKRCKPAATPEMSLNSAQCWESCRPVALVEGLEREQRPSQERERERGPELGLK